MPSRWKLPFAHRGMKRESAEAEDRAPLRDVRARVLPRHAGGGESTGAVRGSTPFRSAVLSRFGQSLPYAIDVEVLGIDRRTRLLPPRLVQPSGTNAVETQFDDEL